MKRKGIKWDEEDLKITELNNFHSLGSGFNPMIFQQRELLYIYVS